MASVYDVAAYILEKQGEMAAMKLQKLVYYSHAWHLVWEERPLFPDRIEAWANGPVSPSLYRAHRLQFMVSKIDEGDASCLSDDERSTVDAVLNFYAGFSAHQLSELTHKEAPWVGARGNLPAGARSQSVIGDAAMHEYYDSLTPS
jgi:uncharacterized phage-associated protein